jgi:O-methyltransferase involved in polyketide biosynthesis
MKQQQSSRSAEGVAGLRAIEAEKPEGERICYDPLAKAFSPAGLE